MKLFGFLNCICIYIAIFCSYCKNFTIKPGQFKLIIAGEGWYSNSDNLRVDENETFNSIINRLTFEAKDKSCRLTDNAAIRKKIVDILGKEDLFLAKDKSTGHLSIMICDTGFQECHANCEFIFRDKIFGLGAINYEYWNYTIDKDYKRKFLEIVLKYANGDFKDWKEFSDTLRKFISEVLENNKLAVQYNKMEELAIMQTFVGKNDKFSFDLACAYYDFSGLRSILDIKNFLTEVDRKKFINTNDLFFSECLIIYISDRNLNKLSFHSSNQDYVLKHVSQNIYICNFFEYGKTLKSDDIHKLLKGNGYDIYQDCQLSFGKNLYNINVATNDSRYADKRPKGTLKFIYDNNIFKYVDENAKILEKEEIYLDELDNELRYCKDSLEYDKSKFKDGGTFNIEIVKPIEGKVKYVEKNVNFELFWNLIDIYDLKTDKYNIRKEFKIDATYTLKSILGEFFKEVNKSLKIDNDYCPYYEVFDGEGEKLDPENYKILKDENFTIKLDIFDDKYFEKKNCSRNLKIQIKDYKEPIKGIMYIYVPKVKEFETSFKEGNDINLLKKMLKEELQKKVFTNSEDIEFQDISDKGAVVELSIKNLAEKDIKETKFVTSIKAKAPTYFIEKEHISYLPCEINKDSTLEDAIKNIVEEIKKELKKKNKNLKDPVFDFIEYDDSGFSIIDNGSKITPCNYITLMFKADENINNGYIYEYFPIDREVIISLKQDNDYFALKKEVDEIIKNISTVKLHEDATCENFLKKVAQVLQDKTKFKYPPVLSFRKEINLKDSVGLVSSDNLCLYLDPSLSSEYVEKNKDFDGVLLSFELKCNINNYKLKNDYNNKGIYFAVKDINNGKVTFEDLKKAIEENYKIKPNQCKIYDNNNKEFKDKDIINDKNFVVEITDASLLDYLTPLKEMTFTIDYKYDENDYKLKNDTPIKLTVPIAEEDLNKENIYNFIKDYIITTIEKICKVKSSSIFPYSLNNNKVSDNPNIEVNGCIKASDKNIIVLQLSSGCNLLESKEKPEEETPNEEGPEEGPKGKPKEKPKETTQKGEDVKTRTEDKKGCCKKCGKPGNDNGKKGCCRG